MSDRSETYLRKQKSAAKDAELQDTWSAIESQYQKKLWHQLTESLFQNLINGSLGPIDTKELYDNFIADFEHRVNTLQLAMICIPIAHDIFAKDPATAFDFLKRRERICGKDKTAMIRLQTGEIELKLKTRDENGNLREPAEVRRLIEITQEALDGVTGVTPVHAPFYKVSSQYLKDTQNHAAYYREALRYLGCEDQNKLSDEEKLEQAVLLGFAALLGENIYNFGELLAHPILSSLKGSTHNWLLEVLLAFNSGDIPKFVSLKNKWGAWPDLKSSEEAIMNKIRLLCVMEMAITRPSKDRYITFEEIAQKAQVPEKQVEYIVMRALSKNLISGTINQVEKTVTVTWVQPRVLSVDQIGSMRNRITQWNSEVEAMGKVVEEHAKEILTIAKVKQPATEEAAAQS